MRNEMKKKTIRKKSRNTSVFTWFDRNINIQEKQMMKRRVAVVFVLFLGVLFCGSMFSGTSGSTGICKENYKDLLAPINPEFLKYMDNVRDGSALSRTDAGNGRLMGVVPSPVDYSHVKGTIDEKVDAADFPIRYDLRDLDLIPAIRNQAGYPTCWIFAAFSSLESCLLPEVSANFSEWHMAVTHGYDYSVHQAGNSFMTTAYFVRWSGPLDESTVPYDTSRNVDLPFVPERHVQEVIYLPNREGPLDNNSIKYYIMNHGAVDFAYNWENTGYNGSTYAMYTPNNAGQNHRLGLVGWDDNFPAYKFNHRPPGNGAFVARNSWGEGFGEDGYCYISYYDLAFEDMICFVNAEEPNNYGTIYQYDPLGHTRTWGKSESWGANVFTSEDDSLLEAVGFFAADAGLKYEIYVYKNVSGNDPTNGTLTTVKTGGLVYGGYYTIKLDELVPLARGERFSAVVKFMTTTRPHSVPLETPILGFSSQASANPGESYVSLDGQVWEDLTDVVDGSNVCIKAYSQYKASNVTLQVERKTVGGWIVIRDYGDVTVHVDNLQEVPISRLVIEKSYEGSEFSVLLELSPDDLVNGSYNFSDKYLERTGRYSYRATAYAPEGFVSAKTDPVTI
jgi:C1A family cysteine protease